uniref:Uncharacterized protein n=1 Tax=Anguilla anguilla TaxID=7936 RepID=A0A0E9ST15_ANGAN
MTQGINVVRGHSDCLVSIRSFILHHLD